MLLCLTCFVIFLPAGGRVHYPGHGEYRAGELTGLPPSLLPRVTPPRRSVTGSAVVSAALREPDPQARPPLLLPPSPPPPSSLPSTYTSLGANPTVHASLHLWRPGALPAQFCTNPE